MRRKSCDGISTFIEETLPRTVFPGAEFSLSSTEMSQPLEVKRDVEKERPDKFDPLRSFHIHSILASVSLLFSISRLFPNH